MNRKRIERGWQSYLRHCVPPDASETQIRETRQAFYSGASMLFIGVTGQWVTSDQDVTDPDLMMMQDLQAEVDAFGQELDMRVFKTAEH